MKFVTSAILRWYKCKLTEVVYNKVVPYPNGAISLAGYDLNPIKASALFVTFFFKLLNIYNIKIPGLKCNWLF